MGDKGCIARRTQITTLQRIYTEDMYIHMYIEDPNADMDNEYANVASTRGPSQR